MKKKLGKRLQNITLEFIVNDHSGNILKFI